MTLCSPWRHFTPSHSSGCDSKFRETEKQRALRRYLGMVNYYHRFIPHCAEKLTPVNSLLTEANEGQNRLSPKSNFELHWTENANVAFTESKQILANATLLHLPDSQARCSRGRRPSLAESVLSSTYWGREDDLVSEYSFIFQPNANLMLAHCLRHWLNINPTLPHVTSRVW